MADHILAKQVEVPEKEYAGMMPGLGSTGSCGGTGHHGMAFCAEGYGGQFVTVVPDLGLVVTGGSALDERTANTIQQFLGIYRILDKLILPAAQRPRTVAPWVTRKSCPPASRPGDIEHRTLTRLPRCRWSIQLAHVQQVPDGTHTLGVPSKLLRLAALPGDTDPS